MAIFMQPATYVGPDIQLNNRTALLIESATPGKVRAQFDSRLAWRDGICLAFNWHEFDAGDFRLREENQLKPCAKCGYEFDLDKLGKYGCPNCEGHGLDRPSPHV